jgi:hypothetical protein
MLEETEWLIDATSHIEHCVKDMLRSIWGVVLRLNLWGGDGAGDGSGVLRQRGM